MFNNVALDVFIGLVFVFLIYSLLATIFQEIIATRFAFRAKILEKAVIRMLEDGKSTTKYHLWDRITAILYLFTRTNQLKDKLIAAWFYSHPLIKYLGEDNHYSKPAYLSAQNFSKVMIDLLKGMGTNSVSDIQNINNSVKNGTIYQLPIDINADSDNMAIAALREQVQKLKLLPDSSDDPTEKSSSKKGKIYMVDPNGVVAINMDTKLYIQSLWAESGANVDTFKAGLEQWYNDTMDRASGWYKRYTQYILFIVGLVVAISFNVDTVSIYKILSKDKQAREQLVQMAIKNKDALQKATIDISKADSMRNQAVRDETYNKTLEIVSGDAQSANSVLGLGRPWSDSCTICNDVNKFKSIDKSLAKQHISIDSLKQISDSLKQISKNLKVKIETSSQNLTKLAGTQSKDSLTAILKSLNTNVQATNLLVDSKIKDSIATQNKKNALLTRCAYIKQEKSTHCLKYSTNQIGGWPTFFGWILTALAISLGAPFWFDILNKAMQLRGGNKIDSSSAAKTPASTGGAPPTQTPVSVNVNTQKPGEGAVG